MRRRYGRWGATEEGQHCTMSKSLRMSARWFNRGLWIVALVFAGFLIGLGGTVVDDLPRVDQHLRSEDLVDQGAAAPLRSAIKVARAAQEDADRALEQASLKLQAAQQAYTNEHETFENWLATRKATSLPSQDNDLITRTAALDALKTAQNSAQHGVEDQQQAALDAEQARTSAQQKLDALDAAAAERLMAENGRAELRVFLYRLALTIPLLGLAGWLFVRKRDSPWWPFVWGFIIFSLFSFFVEVVPYLPSYGGYVYYSVGLVVTVLVGRYCIMWLNQYLAQQKLIEQQPDKVRRDVLSYDVALGRIAKGICPGCERPVDLKNMDNSYCPHCGIGLFNNCASCSARKSAFAQFCSSCGAHAAAEAAA